jgi:short-subunit dehydrogenase
VLIIITGVAPHSLGERLVELLSQDGRNQLVCIDLQANASLRTLKQVESIELDLNPLHNSARQEEFGAELATKISSSLDRLGHHRIDALVQSAGTYWSGSLLSSTAEDRRRIFGVNLVGRVEVLHTVLSLNASHGVDNSSTFVHVDIGSFQGIHVREGRSIYASSKAAGIDFLASLNAGNEANRSIYFGPGPIDTSMLHYNHWVIKSNGPKNIHEALKNGDRALYRAIFVEGSEEHFRQYLKVNGLANELMVAFRTYLRTRRTASVDEFGILNVDESARLVASFVMEPDRYPSGVYLALRPRGGDMSVDYRDFATLNRISLFPRRK